MILSQDLRVAKALSTLEQPGEWIILHSTVNSTSQASKLRQDEHQDRPRHRYRCRRLDLKSCLELPDRAPRHAKEDPSGEVILAAAA